MPETGVQLQLLIVIAAAVIGVFLAVIALPKKRRGTIKGSSTLLEERAKQAAELLLDDSSLTEELDDPEAPRLLEWGIAIARQIAEQTASMDDAAAAEFVAAKMQDLRRVVRKINKLVGSLSASASLEETEEVMQGVLDAAAMVPTLQVLPPADLSAAVQSVQSLSPGDALGNVLSFFNDGSNDDTEA